MLLVDYVFMGLIISLIATAIYLIVTNDTGLDEYDHQLEEEE